MSEYYSSRAEWAWEEIGAIMNAINDTPDWEASNPGVFKDGAYISCIARHIPCQEQGSGRLIRAREEWINEYNTHVCEGK